MRNPLNDSDVDGNTMAWMADQKRENTPRYEDQYFCQGCGKPLVEDDANEEYCAECQIDRAENIMEDR